MKTLKFTAFFVAIFLATGILTAQQQIQFAGPVSQGYGIAGWNANGSGPEPAATGHLVPAPGWPNQYYYGSSHDYISGDPNHACFHFISGMAGFPLFEQALTNHGFTPDQVKCKYGLTSLGDDIQGVDWFFMNDWAYSNYYDIGFIFEVDGEPMLSGLFNYANMYINTLGGNWHIESAYTPLTNIAIAGTPAFIIAQAFLDDLDGKEIRTLFQATYGQSFSGNGRSGAYYNVINGILEAGYPQMPCIGLHADNEGTAGWNADGTGPEPYGNGHGDIVYYSASVDYDGINPSPDACLAHCIDGSEGFLNTLLQLQYRGFDVGDLKLKMGLCSLGPDVEGEDWGYENGYQWLNEYNNSFIIELNGEPVLEVLQDTNKMTFINPGTVTWATKSSVGKVYDISENASANAQFVAQSFIKDLGSHYLITEVSDISYVGPMPPGNGRSGVWYELVEGAMVGVHEQASFIPEGPVSGTWTAENSPYYIEGHLTIENGDNLTIEPGVRVGVRGPYHFTVQGCLNAEGTAGNQIMFTASNPNITWDGFDYDYTPATNDTSVFQHCIFKYSSALGYNPANSGGVFAVREFNKLLIDHSIFHSNKALIISGGIIAGGGAIALWTASPVIRNNAFYDNHAMLGGAIFCYENSNPEISRNLFYNNSATSDGGALEIWGNSNPNVVNNTFSLNNANSDGGAVDIYSTSNPVFVNNIFWGNTANLGNQISITSYGCNVNFTYNDIEGGQAGIEPYGIGTGVYENNIDADPEFVDLLNYDFHILESSPCHNTGDPTILDPDGTVSDMGYCFTLCTTSVDESIASALKLTIYPNPVADEGVISYEMIQPAMVKIEICNNLGQIIAEPFHAYQSAGQYKHVFYAEQLQPGIYMLKVTAGQQIYVTKFIKY